jgi:hypothetical protein
VAKIELQTGVKSISGKMGGIVFRTTKGGKVIAAKAPDKNRELSPAELTQRERFIQASEQAREYANAVLADPGLRAIYEKEAAKAHMSPRNKAISDFHKGINLLAEE